MRPREVNPSIRLLVLLAIISLGIFYLAEATRHKKQAPYYDLKLKAANLDKQCQAAIRDELKKRSIAIDTKNDPSGSGLIGEQSTLITTDLGSLRDKLVTVNPNLAAAFVQMFKECHLKRGDRIAVGLTGSLPGANIALYSACEVMDLEPVVITSLGSSTWGANHPDFTWLDMEKVLYDAKLIGDRSRAASLGGGADNGRGLSQTGHKLLFDAINRNDAELIYTDNRQDTLQVGGSLQQNIARRIEIYKRESKEKPYMAYVNIGGGLASLGSSQNGKLIPSGVNFKLYKRNYPASGVINIMAEQKIPIIEILRIQDIAQTYGLSLVVIPSPQVGADSIYYTDQYSLTSTIIYTIILLIIVLVFIRIDVKYYVRRQTNKILFPPKRDDESEL